MDILEPLRAMRKALDDLEDHHCGGYCGEDEEARGDEKHSSVMSRGAAALAGADELEARLSTMRDERNSARYYLRIFLHAYASGNSVSSIMEEEARQAAGPRAAGAQETA